MPLLNNLEKTPGSTRPRKRVGRGTSSGTGKTAGRGQKGQNSRSGGGTRPGFEGGQMPLFRRIPKFGFTNRSQTKYTIFNIRDIVAFKLAAFNHETLYAAKKIKHKGELVKVLAGGEISKPCHVKVDKISMAARHKIEAVGGKVELLGANDAVKAE